jgi:hypothetical protein
MIAGPASRFVRDQQSHRTSPSLRKKRRTSNATTSYSLFRLIQPEFPLCLLGPQRICPACPAGHFFLHSFKKTRPVKQQKSAARGFGRFVDGFVFPIAANKLTPPGARLRKCLLSIPES